MKRFVERPWYRFLRGTATHPGRAPWIAVATFFSVAVI